jgi:hypothetical protein
MIPNDGLFDLKFGTVTAPKRRQYSQRIYSDKHAEIRGTWNVFELQILGF